MRLNVTCSSRAAENHFIGYREGSRSARVTGWVAGDVECETRCWGGVFWVQYDGLLAVSACWRSLQCRQAVVAFRGRVVMGSAGRRRTDRQ